MAEVTIRNESGQRIDVLVVGDDGNLEPRIILAGAFLEIEEDRISAELAEILRFPQKFGLRKRG